MAFSQHSNHVFFCDVGVALGGGNRGVSQEFLDNADVHAIAKQQRCHCMAQHVGSNVPLDSRLLTQLGDYVGNSLGCKSCSGGVEKESGAGRINALSCLKVFPLDFFDLN